MYTYTRARLDWMWDVARSHRSGALLPSIVLRSEPRDHLRGYLACGRQIDEQRYFVGRQGYRLDSGRVAFIRASDSVWSLGPMPLSELRLEGPRMPQEARTWIGR